MQEMTSQSPLESNTIPESEVSKLLAQVKQLADEDSDLVIGKVFHYMQVATINEINNKAGRRPHYLESPETLYEFYLRKYVSFKIKSAKAKRLWLSDGPFPTYVNAYAVLNNAQSFRDQAKLYKKLAKESLEDL